MAVGPRTRPLAPSLYLTNEQTLVYVLDLAEGNQAVIEDARNGEIECVPSRDLEGWRVVVPKHAAA